MILVRSEDAMSLLLLALLAGCVHAGWGCPTKEHAVGVHDDTAGVDAETLVARVPDHEVLQVVPGEETYDADAALAAIGPYEVTVLELDPRDARLRTQYGVGDFCLVEDQLRIPVRILVRSADRSLDARVTAWVTGHGDEAWFESELDPDVADLEGTFPDEVERLVDATTAENRDRCPGDRSIEPEPRLHYTGEIGGDRQLDVDVTYDTECFGSAHAIGGVALTP